MCKVKYYVVEYQYIGVGDKNDLIHIQTTPARDSDGNVCTDGWCQTWGDWASYAHGEYMTLADAQAAVREKFDDVHEDYSCYGDDVIETYKLGYEPLDSYESYDYFRDCIQSDVNRDTTDERIDELVVEYGIIANEDGYTLDDADGLAELIRDYRDELASEDDDDDEDEDEDEDELASANAPD